MDERSLVLLSCLTVVLLLLGLWEAHRLRRAWRAIPVRVHVNGTRGKSSVTRLIAAGLRAGGLATVAKTTGTLPRFIGLDGREMPLYRPGRANIGEQFQVLERARQAGAQAIVVECMALQPFLQWVTTGSIVRPTLGVMTNVRPDHLDVMGPDLAGVALALAGSVPVGGQLLSAERRFENFFRSVALERGSTYRVVRPETSAIPVTDRELRRFRYIEHAENVELALSVCAELGVSREIALRGMQGSRPDPGALTIEYIQVDGQRLVFVNGFAANDPESTAQVWELALARTDSDVRRVALFNCRKDRPERSTQLGQVVGHWTRADHYVLVGESTHFFVQGARERIPASCLHHLERSSADVLLRELAGLAGPGGVVVGLCNIGGIGLELLAEIRKP